MRTAPPAACAAARAANGDCRAAGAARSVTLRGIVEPQASSLMLPPLRPFSANRPCGRFWMKTMMNTSTAIFASTAPDHASSSLLSEAEPERRVHRAGELADAAEHDDHERVDDVALAEVGADVADLRQRAAGESGDARAERRRRACRRAPVGTPTHAGHRAVLRDAADEQAEPRARRSASADRRAARAPAKRDDRRSGCTAARGCVITSTPPDIHAGFSTCTFCAPKIVRTAWIRIRLMPQVASSVSSGRP